jgi:hypothetical protein
VYEEDRNTGGTGQLTAIEVGLEIHPRKRSFLLDVPPYSPPFFDLPAGIFLIDILWPDAKSR